MPSGVYKRTLKTPKEIDFDKILQLVLDGWTIENAVFNCGWNDTSYFYRHITKEQKEQIYTAKMIHSQHKRY
jgi:AraC-like DNA-binding protein